MIVDIHAHPNYYGYNVKKLLANMDEYGIDKAWILTLETPADEYHPFWYKNYGDQYGPMPFSAALEFVRAEPERFVLGYGIDPRRPDAIAKLEAAIELYDVKVYGEIMLRIMYDNPDALKMFKYCGEKKLPVIVEVRYGIPTGQDYPRSDWWYGGGIDAFERAIEQCPDTIFLGHGPGFWAHISNDELYKTVEYPKAEVKPGGKLLRMMEKYDNLYLDLSAGSGFNAMNRDRKLAKDLLIKYQDRALYGRDDVNNDLQEFLSSLSLPKPVLDKIYYLNAERLLKDYK